MAVVHACARLEDPEAHPQVPDFDCGVPDLNDFLKTDALPHSQELLAVTLLFYTADNILLGYCSVLNDSIKVESKQTKNRMLRALPFGLRNYRTYPSVKIGRLGVNRVLARRGAGREILDFIKFHFITNNKTGCRFITVDSLRQSVNFYEKCGFKAFPGEVATRDETVLMYFDLRTFALAGKAAST